MNKPIEIKATASPAPLTQMMGRLRQPKSMLKLTPDSCRRMWLEVISAQLSRIGRIWPYQVKQVKSLGRVVRVGETVEQRIARKIQAKLDNLP
jgi:hypothetical protein